MPAFSAALPDCTLCTSAPLLAARSSAETARRQAKIFGTTFERELRLYIVHGLLHLQGFDDQTSAGVREMKSIQERILSSAA